MRNTEKSEIFQLINGMAHEKRDFPTERGNVDTYDIYLTF